MKYETQEKVCNILSEDPFC